MVQSARGSGSSRAEGERPVAPCPVSGPETDALAGLDPDEAERRLLADGPNEIASQRPRTAWRIVFDVLREPMLALLVSAGALYLLLGEPQDAWTLVAFVVVVVLITIVQERRTERALGALRDLSSPRANVLRGGRRMRIPGREVVRGDVVWLSEGDRVPADALVRRARDLSVDESLLTGESVPVSKRASSSAAALDAPGGDDRASVFAGTLVTSGHGVAEVLATGERAELGRIGRALARIPVEPTRLQRDTRRLVRWFALGGLAVSAVIAVVYALGRGGSSTAWKEGLLAGIAAAMSLLPEELAVVLGVYLSIGAWRLARDGVLARRMPAVEALGATTVLCTDKTGTLTENRMRLVVLSTQGRSASPGGSGLDAAARGLLETALLASRREAFDPMERALQAAGELVDAPQPGGPRELVREYPLAPGLPALTRAWGTSGSRDLEVASKGAPEAIAGLCRLEPPQREAMLAEVARLAGEGRRVLAVARATVSRAALPDEHAALALELVGLLAFEDPLRASVPAAIAECRRAGIRVVMVTGDHPATARAIAARAGLEHPDAVLTGAELALLGDAELAQRAGSTGVFARVVPEQKLRIVRALAARGEIVAMTGDGVNDAPALRAAHVGVAMGARGTDVAREAADLVLLDDEFTSIVGAIRTGRAIFDNIQKAMGFIVAVHVPIAALTLGQVMWPSAPLLLLPVHLAFLELVIDPACSLVFEAEEPEPGIMDRPPRPAGRPLLSRRRIVLAVLEGASAFAACAAILVSVGRDQPPEVARALAFTTLVVTVVVLVFANRSSSRAGRASPPRRNLALSLLVAGTATMLAAVLLVPALRRLFRFGPPDPADLAVALAAGLAPLLWLEVLERRRRSRPSRGAVAR